VNESRARSLLDCIEQRTQQVVSVFLGDMRPCSYGNPTAKFPNKSAEIL